jgi:peptidoglycan/xylan/chitin deacetylase (PgdA/CDA1 family)
LDYYDIDYPEHGCQRSLFNAMRDLRRERGLNAQPHLHLTAFAIASQQARSIMDKECLFGCDWMRDTWWRAAGASGLMAIENHSYDHNHPVLPSPGIDDMPRGSFLHVDNAIRAEAEIAAAQQLLNDRLAPRRSTLFCYPFGHVPDYLRLLWLPDHGEQHGLLAAFGDGAQPIELASERWNLPRYICGWHWKSPDGLAAILRDACT